jgi:hypothetical protein
MKGCDKDIFIAGHKLIEENIPRSISVNAHITKQDLISAGAP